MSVNSRMLKYELYILSETESLSGAIKKEWKRDGICIAAVHQLDQFTNTEAYRNTETTHAGVTAIKGLKAHQARLKRGTEQYEIVGVDDAHRLAQLSIKEVILW